MSWRVEVVKNTVKINPKTAKRLFEASSTEYGGKTYNDIFEDPELVSDNGILQFNPDHREHIDYLINHKELIDILVNGGARGEVLFADTESSPAIFWGHRFTKAGHTPIRGRVVWEVGE